MKRRWVVHPLLFAIFPVLALYAHNMHELSFSETLVPLAIAFGSTLALLLSLWLMLRDSRKAGIIVSVLALLFFSYGHVLDVIVRQNLPLRDRGLLLIWGALIVISAYLVIRTRRDLTKPTVILNVVAAVLILIPSVNIVAYEVGRPSFTLRHEISTNVVAPGEADTLPDIYYIILDSYASSSTLREYDHFDNEAFTDYLTENDFYIASESRSNYGSTSLSLPSSLNMEYINYLSDTVGAESRDMTIPYQMIKDNEVIGFLTSRGYKSIHIGNWWGPTRHNEYADLNLRPTETNRTEFGRILVQTTMLTVLENQLFQSAYREYVLGAFDKLAQVPEIEGPKFVFAHIISPHWPYVFGADGQPIDVVDWRKDKIPVQRAKWLNQVRFVNKKVEVLVDEILSKSEIPPIIVLQADHGPRLVGKGDDPDLPNREYLRDTMRIFNAYHLPRGGNDLLWASISPVNTFRVIFNYYFNASYELLPDDSYYSDGLGTPYRFFDVTQEVSYD